MRTKLTHWFIDNVGFLLFLLSLPCSNSQTVDVTTEKSLRFGEEAGMFDKYFYDGVNNNGQDDGFLKFLDGIEDGPKISNQHSGDERRKDTGLNEMTTIKQESDDGKQLKEGVTNNDKKDDKYQTKKMKIRKKKKLTYSGFSERPQSESDVGVITPIETMERMMHLLNEGGFFSNYNVTTTESSTSMQVLEEGAIDSSQKLEQTEEAKVKQNVFKQFGDHVKEIKQSTDSTGENKVKTDESKMTTQVLSYDNYTYQTKKSGGGKKKLKTSRFNKTQVEVKLKGPSGKEPVVEMTLDDQQFLTKKKKTSNKNKNTTTKIKPSLGSGAIGQSKAGEVRLDNEARNETRLNSSAKNVSKQENFEDFKSNMTETNEKETPLITEDQPSNNSVNKTSQNEATLNQTNHDKKESSSSSSSSEEETSVGKNRKVIKNKGRRYNYKQEYPVPTPVSLADEPNRKDWTMKNKGAQNSKTKIPLDSEVKPTRKPSPKPTQKLTPQGKAQKQTTPKPKVVPAKQESSSSSSSEEEETNVGKNNKVVKSKNDNFDDPSKKEWTMKNNSTSNFKTDKDIASGKKQTNSASHKSTQSKQSEQDNSSGSSSEEEKPSAGKNTKVTRKQSRFNPEKVYSIPTPVSLSDEPERRDWIMKTNSTSNSKTKTDIASEKEQTNSASHKSTQSKQSEQDNSSDSSSEEEKPSARENTKVTRKQSRFNPEKVYPIPNPVSLTDDPERKDWIMKNRKPSKSKPEPLDSEKQPTESLSKNKTTFKSKKSHTAQEKAASNKKKLSKKGSSSSSSSKGENTNTAVIKNRKNVNNQDRIKKIYPIPTAVSLSDQPNRKDWIMKNNETSKSKTENSLDNQDESSKNASSNATQSSNQIKPGKQGSSSSSEEEETSVGKDRNVVKNKGRRYNYDKEYPIPIPVSLKDDPSRRDWIMKNTGPSNSSQKKNPPQESSSSSSSEEDSRDSSDQNNPISNQVSLRDQPNRKDGITKTKETSLTTKNKAFSNSSLKATQKPNETTSNQIKHGKQESSSSSSSEEEKASVGKERKVVKNKGRRYNYDKEYPIPSPVSLTDEPHRKDWIMKNNETSKSKTVNSLDIPDKSSNNPSSNTAETSNQIKPAKQGSSSSWSSEEEETSVGKDRKVVKNKGRRYNYEKEYPIPIPVSLSNEPERKDWIMKNNETSKSDRVNFLDIQDKSSNSPSSNATETSNPIKPAEQGSSSSWSSEEEETSVGKDRKVVKNKGRRYNSEKEYPIPIPVRLSNEPERKDWIMKNGEHSTSTTEIPVVTEKEPTTQEEAALDQKELSKQESSNSSSLPDVENAAVEDNKTWGNYFYPIFFRNST